MPDFNSPKEFFTLFLKRIGQLVLECISFNFFMFIMIVHFFKPVITNITGIDITAIIDLLAAGGSLAYKFQKDKLNGNGNAKIIKSEGGEP